MKRIGRIILVVLIFCVCSIFTGALYMEVYGVELLSKPPIQASGVQIVDGYRTIEWDANSEEDLGGYIFGYSIGAVYIFTPGNFFFDVGYTTSIQIADFPPEHYTKMAVEGQQVHLVLYAYDKADPGGEPYAYEIGDNVSGASDPISISFFVKQPPLAPQNVNPK